MINILKAEFKKFFKTKTFIILTIITIIFPLFTTGMYKILDSMLSSDDPIGLESLVNALQIFKNSFSPMQNYGLILLIFILVLLINDFTQNTIRNKLIAGYDRTKVFLSAAIFSLTIMFVAITIYAFLNYFLTGFLISFGDVKTIEIVEAYVYNITSLLVVYSFLILIGFIFKRLGATLGIVLGTLFLVMIAFSIISIGISGETTKIMLIIMPFLEMFNPLVVSEINIFLSIGINLIYTVGLIGLGVLATNKMDFK